MKTIEDFREWMREKQITEHELNVAKENCTAFCGLYAPRKELLHVAREYPVLEILLYDGVWGLRGTPSNEPLQPGHVYRILEEVTLLTEKPKVREGNEPFLYEIDGEETLCCPVFRELGAMSFYQTGLTRFAGDANNFDGFLGCVSADENGWPDRWLLVRSRDLSMILESHHCGLVEIAFVCFLP